VRHQVGGGAHAEHQGGRLVGLLAEGEPLPLGAGVADAHVLGAVGAQVLVSGQVPAMEVDEEQSQRPRQDARRAEVVARLAAATDVDVPWSVRNRAQYPWIFISNISLKILSYALPSRIE